MRVFSFLLTFKANRVISFGLKKVPQEYPQQLCYFLGVGDDFSFEKKVINKKKTTWKRGVLQLSL
jgi:hypothetical protein